MQTTLRNSLLNTRLAWLCAATVTLGLMSANVLAREDLAGAATDPISNLIQFQLQDQYNWDKNNAGGYSNALLIQPVVPIKLSSESVPLMITRTTLAYVSTPDPGSPVHRKHGFGDT